MRKMETSNNRTVATNLARNANTLIDAAFSGTLCEQQLGKKIPLPEALQRCGGALISAMDEWSSKVAGAKHFLMMFGGDFNPADSRKVSRKSLEVSDEQ